MSFSIRQLTEADWEIYKDIRLKSLQSDPTSFSSTYETESQFSQHDWQKDLLAPTKAIFGLFDNRQPIGISFISIPKKDISQSTAKLLGSWIDKKYRNKGLSNLLYDARIEWAKKHPTVERLIIAHYDYNIASKASNQKHGFVFTHKETYEDGKTDLWYELWVKPKPLER
ncbi:MAG: GNAT family N-acetyltransferase [Alphaproteobacteria bacterium]